MPRYSERAHCIRVLEGWLKKYMTLQARSRRRFQIYSDTRLDHDDFNVSLTKSRFLKTIRCRLQRIKCTRYLHRAARYRISACPD